LVPKEPGETEDRGTGPKKAGVARPLSLPVLAVIAKALAENPTPAARQAIADILAGAFGLENDQVAVQVTLKALADHPSDENDCALLAALTQPDKIRPAGQGQVTPETLQKVAFGVIEQNGKSGIRLRLAKRLAEPSCPRDLRRIVTPIFERRRPENIEAQAILFQSEAMEPKTEALIEKQLLDYSHEALVRVFGLPSERSASGADPAGPFPSADPDWLDHMVRLLWNDRMVAVLSSRQVAMTSLDRSPTTILLAATIPTTEARSRLARTLARHWEENPNALKSAGWTKTLLSEPGMLAVLKTVRGSRSSPDRGDAKRVAILGRLTAKRADSATGVSQVREPPAKSDDAWLAVEEALVREYCRRFLVAGLVQDRARRDLARADAPKTAGPPPAIALHPEASVLTSYRVQWPRTRDEKLADATRDVMEVSYVRVEEMAIPRAVLAHYQRTVKPFQLHPLADGVWLETLLPADGEGRCRSIDVVLTRANPKSETPPDKPQELTVEILVVNIPALKAGARTKAQAGAEPDPDGLP